MMGDNIDKTICPRQETIEHHTQSLHYFHAYAVKDRCDMSHLQDVPSRPSVSNVDVDLLLPSQEDSLKLHENVTVLVERVNHCMFFKENLKVMTPHINHPYSRERGVKSEVVSVNCRLLCYCRLVSIIYNLYRYL